MQAFALASPQLAKDYSVPAVFSEDLFEVLGEDERPDYRWLIVGPRRSGSSFHVDPNATCAWNASVRGRKKWILFPPGAGQGHTHTDRHSHRETRTQTQAHTDTGMHIHKD